MEKEEKNLAGIAFLFGISIATIMLLTFYLSGCYVHATFNIAKWDGVTRFFFGGFGTILSIVVGIVLTVIYYDNQKEK